MGQKKKRRHKFKDRGLGVPFGYRLPIRPNSRVTPSQFIPTVRGYKHLHPKTGIYPLKGRGPPPPPHAERHKMAAAALCLNLAPPLGLAPPRYWLSSIFHFAQLVAGLLPRSGVRNAEAQIHTPSIGRPLASRPAPAEDSRNPTSTKWRTKAFSSPLFICHAWIT